MENYRASFVSVGLTPPYATRQSGVSLPESILPVVTVHPHLPMSYSPAVGRQHAAAGGAHLSTAGPTASPARLEAASAGVPHQPPHRPFLRAFDDSHMPHDGEILPKLSLNNDSLKHSSCKTLPHRQPGPGPSNDGYAGLGDAIVATP